MQSSIGCDITLRDSNQCSVYGFVIAINYQPREKKFYHFSLLIFKNFGIYLDYILQSRTDMTLTISGTMRDQYFFALAETLIR